MNGSLVSRLLTGTFWNGLALALNQGGTFLGSIIVARLLGQVAFGEYAIVLATLMSVSVLAQTGLAFAATKYIAEFRSVDPLRTGRIVGLCLMLGPALAALCALGVAVAAPWVAQPVLGSAKLALPLAVGAVFILFYAANSYQVGALAGLERYRALVLPAAACMVLTMAAIAAGAKMGGVTGAVAGLSAATAIRWYLHQRTLRSECQKAGIAISSAGIWGEAPALYGFAIPAALSGFLMIGDVDHQCVAGSAAGRVYPIGALCGGVHAAPAGDVRARADKQRRNVNSQSFTPGKHGENFFGGPASKPSRFDGEYGSCGVAGAFGRAVAIGDFWKWFHLRRRFDTLAAAGLGGGRKHIPGLLPDRAVRGPDVDGLGRHCDPLAGGAGRVCVLSDSALWGSRASGVESHRNQRRASRDPDRGHQIT